jgi:hypothetical protein
LTSRDTRHFTQYGVTVPGEVAATFNVTVHRLICISLLKAVVFWGEAFAFVLVYVCIYVHWVTNVSFPCVRSLDSRYIYILKNINSRDLMYQINKINTKFNNLLHMKLPMCLTTHHATKTCGLRYCSTHSGQLHTPLALLLGKDPSVLI